METQLGPSWHPTYLRCRIRLHMRRYYLPGRVDCSHPASSPVSPCLSHFSSSFPSARSPWRFCSGRGSRGHNYAFLSLPCGLEDSSRSLMTILGINFSPFVFFLILFFLSVMMLFFPPLFWLDHGVLAVAAMSSSTFSSSSASRYASATMTSNGSDNGDPHHELPHHRHHHHHHHRQSDQPEEMQSLFHHPALKNAVNESMKDQREARSSLSSYSLSNPVGQVMSEQKGEHLQQLVSELSELERELHYVNQQRHQLQVKLPDKESTSPQRVISSLSPSLASIEEKNVFSDNRMMNGPTNFAPSRTANAPRITSSLFKSDYSFSSTSEWLPCSEPCGGGHQRQLGGETSRPCNDFPCPVCNLKYNEQFGINCGSRTFLSIVDSGGALGPIKCQQNCVANESCARFSYDLSTGDCTLLAASGKEKDCDRKNVPGKVSAERDDDLSDCTYWLSSGSASTQKSWQMRNFRPDRVDLMKDFLSPGCHIIPNANIYHGVHQCSKAVVTQSEKPMERWQVCQALLNDATDGSTFASYFNNAKLCELRKLSVSASKESHEKRFAEECAVREKGVLLLMKNLPTSQCDSTCQTTEFSPWSSCVNVVDEGWKVRIRSVTSKPFGDDRCPHLKEVQACNSNRQMQSYTRQQEIYSAMQAQSTADCVMQDWGPWSECSLTCITLIKEVGKDKIPSQVVRTRKRGVLQNYLIGHGHPCPLDIQTQQVEECSKLKFCSDDSELKEKRRRKKQNRLNNLAAIQYRASEWEDREKSDFEEEEDNEYPTMWRNAENFYTNEEDMRYGDIETEGLLPSGGKRRGEMRTYQQASALIPTLLETETLVNSCLVISYSAKNTSKGPKVIFFTGEKKFIEQEKACSCPKGFIACSKADAQAHMGSWKANILSMCQGKETEKILGVHGSKMQFYDCKKGAWKELTAPLTKDAGDAMCQNKVQAMLCHKRHPTCVATDYSSWTGCSEPCGKGKQYRWRKMVKGDCKGEPVKEDRDCSLGDCPEEVVSGCKWQKVVQLGSEKSFYDFSTQGCKCPIEKEIACNAAEASASKQTWKDDINKYCENFLNEKGEQSNVEEVLVRLTHKVGLRDNEFIDCTGSYGRYPKTSDEGRSFCTLGARILCRSSREGAKIVLDKPLDPQSGISPKALNTIQKLNKKGKEGIAPTSESDKKKMNNTHGDVEAVLSLDSKGEAHSSQDEKSKMTNMTSQEGDIPSSTMEVEDKHPSNTVQSQDAFDEPNLNINQPQKADEGEAHILANVTEAPTQPGISIANIALIVGGGLMAIVIVLLAILCSKRIQYFLGLNTNLPQNKYEEQQALMLQQQRIAQNPYGGQLPPGQARGPPPPGQAGGPPPPGQAGGPPPRGQSGGPPPRGQSGGPLPPGKAGGQPSLPKAGRQLPLGQAGGQHQMQSPPY